MLWNIQLGCLRGKGGEGRKTAVILSIKVPQDEKIIYNEDIKVGAYTLKLLERYHTLYEYGKYTRWDNFWSRSNYDRYTRRLGHSVWVD